jgi:hypothetical protein
VRCKDYELRSFGANGVPQVTTLLVGDVSSAIWFFTAWIASIFQTGDRCGCGPAHLRRVTHESGCLDGSTALNDANEDDD